MHKKFLPFLVDPKTGEDLELTIEKEVDGLVLEGELKSPSNTYPIVRGIPRFAGFDNDGSYAQSFGYEWNRWPRLQFEDQNIGRPMQGHTKKMWEVITSQGDANLNGKTVAEFGCGSGRFLDIARKKGARVIGLDLSAAVEAARENFKGDQDVLICQADVLNSPIRPDSLDGVFSIGVLHHSTAPAKGFQEMVKTIKPDGWIALAVYGQGGFYGDKISNFWRKLFKKTWPIFGHYPPLIYSYFTVYGIGPLFKIPVLHYLAYVLRIFFPFFQLPDRRWSLLDTFDGVTPSNQSNHSTYEVFRWFKDNGLKDVEPSDWGGTSWHGIK